MNLRILGLELVPSSFRGGTTVVVTYGHDICPSFIDRLVEVSEIAEFCNKSIRGIITSFDLRSVVSCQCSLHNWFIFVPTRLVLDFVLQLTIFVELEEWLS